MRKSSYSDVDDADDDGIDMLQRAKKTFWLDPLPSGSKSIELGISQPWRTHPHLLQKSLKSLKRITRHAAAATNPGTPLLSSPSQKLFLFFSLSSSGNPILAPSY
jgi:hypothetical protein